MRIVRSPGWVIVVSLALRRDPVLLVHDTTSVSAQTQCASQQFDQ